jgi:hypothetical protein
MTFNFRSCGNDQNGSGDAGSEESGDDDYCNTTNEVSLELMGAVSSGEVPASNGVLPSVPSVELLNRQCDRVVDRIRKLTGANQPGGCQSSGTNLEAVVRRARLDPQVRVSSVTLLKPNHSRRTENSCLQVQLAC